MRRTIAIAALVLLGAASPGAPPQLLREQVWTTPGPQFARVLTRAPGECLAQTNASVEVGRALFRSPALLGGPAARAGLSCNACHSNGRVNAYFFLQELTDRVGHADVTSEWASRVRGDGIANPIPIPDLAGAASKATFGQRQVPTLEAFVHGVIEEEFQGAAPTRQAFDGVIAYLRALRMEACPVDAQITLANAADDVRRAVAAARIADTQTASLLLAAGQDAVGRIVERLPQRTFARDRRRFEDLARDLGAARGANVGAALEEVAWSGRFDAAVARVARRERRTYFNEATLAAALAR